MARGTRADLLEFDNTQPTSNDHFLMTTAEGLTQVPRSSVPGIDGRLVFVTGDDSPLALTEEVHYRKFLNLNNSAQEIEVILPAPDSVLTDVEALRFGGLFADGVAASSRFDVSFTVADTAPGSLRAVSPGDLPDLSGDVAFLGLTRALADEALFRIYKRGSLWVVESPAGWRSNAEDSRDREITITGSVNRQITDNDHRAPLWLRASNPGTLTFQSDIASGTVVNLVNNGGAAATIDFGQHTQVGGGNIVPASRSATMIVGDATSGVNKNIFIAISS